MEHNINDHILLVGEANFSFTISLADYCADKSLITTTCYESEQDLLRIYGVELIETNFNLLKTKLGINKVYCGIDACKLQTYPQLRQQLYSRVIFMFPHAICKKTNLKLNRQLLESFLLSSKHMLKHDGCVYVALAKGQGGTKFDVNFNKTSLNANDNWQLIHVANKCGFLLTDVYRFNKDLFSYYCSTGYKIKNRAFNTENSLVHKLELSLPTDYSNIFVLNAHLVKLNKLITQNYDCLIGVRVPILHETSDYCHRYLKKAFYLHELTVISNRNPSELINNPLINLKCAFIEFLKNDLVQKCVKFSFIDDNFINLHMSTSEKTSYEINDNSNRYYIRNTLCTNDFLAQLNEDCLNLCSALLLQPDYLDVSESDIELNEYKYKLLLHIKLMISENNENFVNKLKVSIISTLFYKFLLNYYQNKDSLEIENVNFKNSNEILYKVNDKILFSLSVKRVNGYVELVFELNCCYLCLLVNNLIDKRILYSNDKRNFVINSLKFKPFLLQTTVYTHDICFWYDKLTFDKQKFLRIIRENCFDYIRFVKFIEDYEKPDCESDDRFKHSAFYRFIYESYDCALDFDYSNSVQNKLRERLKALDIDLR